MDLGFLSPVASSINTLVNGQRNSITNAKMAEAQKLAAQAQLLGVQDSIKTNDLNYQLQKENLAYQKSLQHTIFQREDTAVARRMADLKNAGLSATLAAGSAANAGQAISTKAPEKQSNLEAMMTLANVQTRLAEQQRAQTEADIAKQRLFGENLANVGSFITSLGKANNLYQNVLDSSYYTRRGISPSEHNMDWQQRLVNLIAPKLETWLTGLSDSAIPSIVNHVKNTVAPLKEPTHEDGKVVNSNGQSITDGQVALLKQKSLYREFLQSGFTDRVVKALDTRSRSSSSSSRSPKGSYSYRGHNYNVY